MSIDVHMDCSGGRGGGRGGSSNRNASRDESVETGDESIEAGEKHNNHVIIANLGQSVTLLI